MYAPYDLERITPPDLSHIKGNSLPSRNGCALEDYRGRHSLLESMRLSNIGADTPSAIAVDKFGASTKHLGITSPCCVNVITSTVLLHVAHA